MYFECFSCWGTDIKKEDIKDRSDSIEDFPGSRYMSTCPKCEDMYTFFRPVQIIRKTHSFEYKER
jgi:hypothetical protein